jgi:3-oxoacyl-[acyl-carrier protein] reductase
VDTGLADKTAIVTGAGSGIGLACSRALAAEGAHVVLADLDAASAATGAAALGERCSSAQVDVTSPDACRLLVETALERTGRLDVLVTCAGIFHATPFDQITAEEWDHIQAVNLKGTFLTCQAALRVMVPQRSGRIVTIASVAGQIGGLAAGASYAASKAAVVALTKSIARYAGPHGVVANAVNPGVIETPMIDAWPPDLKQRVIDQTPLGRAGTADEVAAVVLVLASDAAAYVLGAHVDVNGGMFMS